MAQGYLIGKMSQAKKRITPLIVEVLPFDMGRPYKGWVSTDCLLPRIAML